MYSYPDVAHSLGLDADKMLATAGISRQSLDQPETRLPAEPCIRLLEESAQISGCDSFGLRMAQCRSFASIGGIALLLERLGTLGDVLTTIGRFRRHLSEVLCVAVQTIEDTAIATFDLVPPFSRTQAADLTVGMGYLMLVGATHRRWSPETVHFTHPVPDDRITFERFFQAPLEFNSAFNGFSFDSADLKMPLPLADPMMANHAQRMLSLVRLPAFNAPVSDHTRHSISLLLSDGNASVDRVAANLSQTPRGLQRALQAEGTKFGDLLNEVKRDLAQRLLSPAGGSITSVSQSLGYANLPAFSRWFEQEFGMPPTKWRASQRRKAA